MRKVIYFLFFFIFSLFLFNQNSFGFIKCIGGVAYECAPCNPSNCSRWPSSDYLCKSQIVFEKNNFNENTLKNDRNINNEIFQDDLSKQDIDKTKEDLEEVFGDYDAKIKEKVMEELISKYGDPNKYEMTPDNYAKYLLLQQPTISDSNDMENFENKLKGYTTKWMVKNFGDPNKYEMTPDNYAKYLLLQQPDILESDDVQRLENRLNYYTAKWMVKNFGDPNKYEMLPEHYIRYVLITSPHTLEPSDEEKLADKIIDYTRKWEERLYRINNIISQ